MLDHYLYVSQSPLPRGVVTAIELKPWAESGEWGLYYRIEVPCGALSTCEESQWFLDVGTVGAAMLFGDLLAHRYGVVVRKLDKDGTIIP